MVRWQQRTNASPNLETILGTGEAVEIFMAVYFFVRCSRRSARLWSTARLFPRDAPQPTGRGRLWPMPLERVLRHKTNCRGTPSGCAVAERVRANAGNLRVFGRKSSGHPNINRCIWSDVLLMLVVGAPEGFWEGASPNFVVSSCEAAPQNEARHHEAANIDDFFMINRLTDSA